MPSVFRSALDGPMSCTQESAVTCGGIISGSRKQKTSAALPRMSVERHEQREERAEDERDHRAGAGSHQRMRSGAPGGARRQRLGEERQVERAAGRHRLHERGGRPARRSTARREERERRAVPARRPRVSTCGAGAPPAPHQPPKSSENFSLFSSSCASASAASKGISLICVTRWEAFGRRRRPGRPGR